jgi:hypothetical protein
MGEFIIQNCIVYHHKRLAEHEWWVLSADLLTLSNLPMTHLPYLGFGHLGYYIKGEGGVPAQALKS